MLEPRMAVELAVKVTPKSSRNAVVVEGDLVRVYVTVPPADGEANRAVLELLAKKLGVAKSRLDIIRGHSSREKVIAVPDLTAEEIRTRLSA